MRQSVRLGSMGERLAEQLRRAIIRGELEVGTHLVEDAVAAQYDVSRGPVRDAFKILSAEGLLDDRRRGFFVRGFSPRDVEELYSLRSSMESLAMRLSAEQTEPERWQPVEAALAGMYEAADRRDWRLFAQHDLAFHGAFYRLSGHSRLQAMWEQYEPIFGAMLDVTNEQDIDLHPTAEDHAILLALTREGRTAELETRLVEHLAGSERRMTTALAPFWARASAR